MIVIGLNIYHPDSSASILIDGEIKTMIEEERFVRIKHFHGFPFESVNHCLRENKLSIEEVDCFVVNFDPKYNIKPRIISSVRNALNPNTFSRIGRYLKKRNLKKLIKVNYPNFKGKIVNIPHHLSHVASSYLCSGMNDAVGISIDGVGDFSSMEIYKCTSNKFQLLYKTNFPHSLGVFYQSITQFLGFKNYGDEYKVMGLAAYGEPKYLEKIKEVITFVPPFDFKLNLKYFNHDKFNDYFTEIQGVPYFDNLFSDKIISLLGKKRQPSEEINQRHMDIAASAQKIFEEIVLKICQNAYLENYSDNLCLSGGCIFNSSMIGKLIENINFKNIFIQPNCGDAGGSLGAALYYSSNKLNKFQNKKLKNIYTGSNYSNDEIETRLKKFNLSKLGYKYLKIDSFDEICEIAVKRIDKFKIIAWYQDRSEWGPRALGNRSFLADPRVREIKEYINRKIKLREEFRPFAPSILKDHQSKYFETNNKFEYLYMGAVTKAKSITKTVAPGIVHSDGTSRIQSVSENSNKKYFKLLKKFYEKYDVPILLNTSFNVNEPIVETPEDAISCFVSTKLETLILNNFIIFKEDLHA